MSRLNKRAREKLEAMGDLPIMVADQTPIREQVKVKPYARVPVPKKSAVPIVAGEIDWSGCPHCAEQRARKAASMKRYRAKK